MVELSGRCIPDLVTFLSSSLVKSMCPLSGMSLSLSGFMGFDLPVYFFVC